ncbi:adenylate/guanylate cyclase domain-containing protein [Phyllobacterium sp. YR531]|uniref:CHASE2 domain-containing protein n=1 Tax=Phyllobacterium sp. YR531 TaxID=1144343 RepID=UPI00026FA121|nr:adenylate/guanylate cyclase domain-containing protein [Phyllobacterium sp. YR531]EJN05380.1 putative transmembrane sensor domain protein [Phyllobacterium sp. YR531]
MNKRLALTLAALILTCVWSAGLGIMHIRGNVWFLERVEATLTDLRTIIRGKKSVPDIVRIIAIDDATVAQAGSYPLARAKLAAMVEEVASLKPKLIALDMLFVDPGTVDGDAALSAALSSSKSLIAAAAVFPDGRQVVDDSADALERVPDAASFLLPQKQFSDAAPIGIVNVATDQSGTPRYIPMLFKRGSEIQPSFSLQAVALASGNEPTFEPGGVSLGDQFIRTDAGQTVPITFYGPRGTIKTISGVAALNGQLTAADVEGKIIVLGTTVTGGGDVFPTPFDQVLPGVEVISTAITQLAGGDSMVRNRLTHMIDAGFAFVIPLILVGLLAWQRSVIGLCAMVAVLVVWLMVNIFAFNSGVWLSASLPITAAGLPVLLFGAVQLFLGRRRAQHFADQSKMLQNVQAPGLGHWLARNPDFLIEPVRQDAAIVFIDLSGFTGLSETLGPNSTRELLNAFYKLVDDEVAACSGTITSYMGDGAMILFGLPQASADDAPNAVRCCINLCNRTRLWLASLPLSSSSRIGFKTGAHFGTVIASRLGGDGRQQITATGDTVNVASRLMEVAASNKAELALSSEILHVAGSDSAPYKTGALTGPLETEIRGRSGSVTIWLWSGAQ